MVKVILQKVKTPEKKVIHF